MRRAPAATSRDAGLRGAVATPTAHRIHDVDAALTRGWDVERVAALSGYDPWFVDQILQIVELRRELRGRELLANVDDAAAAPRQAPRASATRTWRRSSRAPRTRCARAATRPALRPVFKTVDTCAAEFAAQTPYYYSTYEEETEVAPSGRPTVVILGSGPNRIGQGIEFDYSLRARRASRCGAAGFETVMVNCNPETVSTDYDTADRLYFEPLTLEDVLEVCDAERDDLVGVLVQFGGQTPLKLARAAGGGGRDRAGDAAGGDPPRRGPRALQRGPRRARDRPAAPVRSRARSTDALAIADRIGFPVLVRPSYVLGGRAMEIVYDAAQMQAWLDVNAGEGEVLVDRFLENAVEVDVDAVFDGAEVFVGGVMEHIEEAGVHSGDSACVVPPFTLGPRPARAAAGADRGDRGGARHPRARSTSSSRSATPTCSCWRPTRGPRAPCRSSPRPPACRWPRSRRA